MTSDIEDLLRESLEARAQDVRPDPETWDQVQVRVRRERTFRLGLAGLSAAAAVLVAVAIVPGLIERPSVTFDPGPAAPADPGPAPVDPGPAAPGEPVPGPTVGCGSPADTAAVHTHQENVWAMCVNGAVVPLNESGGTALNPAVLPDGSGVVFERWRDELPYLFHVDLATGAEQAIGGGELPAFAPDGRFAYVQQTGTDEAHILVGRLFDEPEYELGVPLTVRQLAWDTQDERLWFESAGRVWTATLDGDFTAVEEHESEAGPQTYFSPAVAPDGTIAVLAADTNRDTLTLGYLDRAVLDGAAPRFTQVASLIPEVHPEMDGLYLVPAGYVWVEPASDVALRWVPADRPAWVVGGDDNVWLVNEEGEMVHLQGGTQALAVNPGADLGAREGRDVIELDPQTGLPHNVEVSRQRIYTAASARDWGALRALMAEDFTSSFGAAGGADEAIEWLQHEDAEGDPLSTIIRLLEGPFGTTVEESEPPITHYVWPREHVEADEHLGYRLGITDDGVWRYFVAGD